MESDHDGTTQTAITHIQDFIRLNLLSFEEHELKYLHRLDDLFEKTLSGRIKKTVTCVVGSLKIKDYFEGINVFYLKDMDWSLYNGQKYIIMDEFNELTIHILDLNRILSGGFYAVSTLKGTKIMIASHILIVSPVEPEQWYLGKPLDQRRNILNFIDEVLIM
jgi:hypothetical protein